MALGRSRSIAPGRAARLLRYGALAAAAAVALPWLLGFAAVARHAQWNWYAVDDEMRAQSPITARIFEALDLEEGLAVADVGAGPGFFTFRMADRVGARGRIYATEINKILAMAIDVRSRLTGYGNVTAVHVGSDGLGLAPDSIDRLLLVNVYLFDGCDPDFTRRFFLEAAQALRPGGLLVTQHDWVRGAALSEGVGSTRACAEPDADELIELSSEWFRVVQVEQVNRDSASAGHGAGYLLVLRTPDQSSRVQQSRFPRWHPLTDPRAYGFHG